MQVDWSKLKLTLKMEYFIKKYVSLIWLLSTIFTVAVERILTNSQPYILSCSSHIPRDNIPKIAWEVFKYYIIS